MLKKFLYLGLGLAVIGAIAAYLGYNAIWSDNINNELNSQTIEIPTGSSYDDVVKLLKENKVLINTASFEQVAGLMNYKKDKVPAGRYKIEKSWNNRQLISALRSGNQRPINITFNNHRTIRETLGDIASYLELDSTDMTNYVLDPKTLENLGQSEETVLSLFIPNTYQFFWNDSAKKVTDRMVKEHNKFWIKNNRQTKLEALGLTKEEVFTLASIVEKESQASHERPIIAGLYLNRLKRDIPLQADPTVVFGVGDFTIRRVLNKHLAHDSPYNTYKYGGLPPGPIYLPSIESIDAVLDPTDHDYIFMCAKPGYGSEHAFAKTSAEHSRNANRYRNWLNSEGIKK